MSTTREFGKAPWPLSLIVLLMLVGIALPLWALLRPPTKWEYKTVSIPSVLVSTATAGMDYGKVSHAAIPVDDRQFESLGSDGWELVSTFLEMQTEHPNFGKEDYVTGIQPNVRPQRLVCIFKRPVSFLSRKQEAPAAPKAEAPARSAPAASSAAPADNASAVGEVVFKKTCRLCHGSGVGGAPALGDAADWRARAAKGMDQLYAHAQGGFTGEKGMMPPKGGNFALSDDEVKAAVEYMVSKSK